MTTVVPATERKNHFRALDGLRGVAALLVVLLHVAWPNHLTGNRFVQHGYLAVDLFFILSGLVISANYADRIANVSDARKFMFLRFFRLYPIHIVVLGAFVMLECAKLVAVHAFGILPGPQAPFTKDASLGALVANLFLLQGLHVLDRPSWNGSSWSISCEFAAYLVFSIAVLMGVVRRKMFFQAGAVLALASYAVLAFTRGTLDVSADWGIVRCLAGFFFGMMIFQVIRTHSLSQTPLLIRVGELAVVGLVIVTMSFTSGPWVVLVIPLFVLAIWLLQSDQGPVGRLLMTQPAQFLGRISYSIYMVHDFLVVCLLIILRRVFVLPESISSIRNGPMVTINPWIGDLLTVGMVAAVLATATATYVFVEEPGRLFGRRLVARSGKLPGHAPNES